MKPFINLDEEIGKTVGRRIPPGDSFMAGMRLQQLAVDLGKSLNQGVTPRGVFRFNTHEEADEWMWKMMARPEKGPVVR